MKGDDLRKIRNTLDWTTLKFGRQLGYEGKPTSVMTHVSAMETGQRKIPRHVSIIAKMLLRLQE